MTDFAVPSSPQRRRISWGSAVLFVLILGVLCALGLWQCARLEWKNRLQHGIDAQLSMIKSCEMSLANAPGSAECFPTLTPNILNHLSKNDIKFGRLKLQLMPRQALLLNGFVQDGKSYFTVIAPARILDETGQGGGQSVNSDAPMITLILGLTLDQNFVKNLAKNTKILIGGPDGQKTPFDLAEPQVFQGVARPAPKNYFSFVLPPNNPDKSEWWRLDLADFAHYWRISALSPSLFYVIPDRPQNVSGGDKNLRGNNINTRGAAPLLTYPFNPVLRNDHLSYAIFWFVMAGIWGIIFFIHIKNKYRDC